MTITLESYVHRTPEETVETRPDNPPKEKQRTLWEVPEPEVHADPDIIRIVRRTRLAFLRLVRLFEHNPDLPCSVWMGYAVRRTELEIARLRNTLDPMAVLRLEGRRERKAKGRTNRMPDGVRKRIVKWLTENDNGQPQCAYCGKLLKDITLDHQKPVSHGGTHQAPNLCFACPQCNGVKGDRTPEEWASDILAAKDRTAAIRRPPLKG